MKIRVNANILELDKVLDFVDKSVTELALGDEVLFQVKVCVEEIFVNIAKYAYPDKSDEYAEVIINYENDWLIIDFVDEGIFFNPLDQDDPDIELAADAREVGGLGVFMVKTLMDEVTYCRKEGKNCLQIRKNLSGE